MNFGEAIKSVFSKYATFSGRARRSEFWYFFLFNLLVSLVLSIIPFLKSRRDPRTGKVYYAKNGKVFHFWVPVSKAD